MKHLHQPASAGKSRIAKNAKFLKGGDALERELLKRVLDAAIEAEQRFAARWPMRHYRVRRAYPVEVEWLAPALTRQLRSDERLHIAAQQLVPGVWLRRVFVAASHFEADLLSEAQAQEMFHAVTPAALVGRAA